MYGHWTGLDVESYAWYFAPGLGAGAIPTNAGQVCVFVGVPSTAFTKLFAHQPASAFVELLSRMAPDLAEQIERAGDTRLQGFAGHPGFFRQAHGPGWALVGDAGYFKDPLTSHGITDALRDAESLAGAIDAGSDDALSDYQAERDAASLELFEVTDEVASFDWSLNEIRVLHERLSKAMSREARLLVDA
jgi:flavin-dependent dehydrogenase